MTIAQMTPMRPPRPREKCRGSVMPRSAMPAGGGLGGDGGGGGKGGGVKRRTELGTREAKSIASPSLMSAVCSWLAAPLGPGRARVTNVLESAAATSVEAVWTRNPI